MLNDTPRRQLAVMLTEDGMQVTQDYKVCESLLRDYCGEYRLEIAALVAFVVSPLASAINGTSLRVDGGVVRSIA